MRSFLFVLCVTLMLSPVRAQEPAPYEPQMLRLAEVLGSLHFLRRLCNRGEGPIWRDSMAALLEAERPSEATVRKLRARFNRGFGAFSRAYARCTPAAVRAAELYQAEGTQLSSQIVSRYAR